MDTANERSNENFGGNLDTGMKNKGTAVIAIRQVSRDTGASRIALGQVKTLSSLGYKVALLCERGDKEKINSYGADCIKFIRFPFRGKIRRFWFNFRVKQWCKMHNPNLIISHGDVETPHILYMHNCVHLAHERKFNTKSPSPLEVAAMHDKIIKGQKYKYLVANSQLMARDFMGRYNIPEEKVRISYPKHDREKFNPASAEKNRAKKRQEIGIEDEKILISLVTSGDFIVRNVSLFIDIAALLDYRNKNKYSFLVVGKSNSAHYKHKAEQLGIKSNLHWLDTTVDVESIYGASDIIVLPAYIETFCCVALEAMACGKPVIMSSWIGASELVEDDAPELVVSGYNAEDWCRQIEKLSDEELRNKLGAESQRIAMLHAESQDPGSLDKLLEK